MVDLAEQTESTLEWVQTFDPQDLVRREELGRSFDFEDAVAPARAVVEFFKQIPVHLLSEISPEQRDQVKSQTDAFWTLLKQVLDFDPANDPNAAANRETLINQIGGWRDRAFNALFPIVAYLATRQRDFSEIERQARKAGEEARAEAARLRSQLEESEAEARRVLSQVKATAAELGVSQQAVYFGAEATEHETAAKNWQRYTVFIAAGLGLFAILTLAIGRWFLVPDTAYEAFQIGLSKVLIFATIAFMLFLSARTLMAHRHNRVVNKHRQNALLTFNALVEATHGEEARDIVLAHASACIFSPQDSGFSKGQSSGQSLVEILPKISTATGHGVS